MTPPMPRQSSSARVRAYPTAAPRVSGSADVTLEHPAGRVHIHEQPGDRRRVTVELRSDGFLPIGVCDTGYPLDLIGLILQEKGPVWLCTEIDRDEDPS